MSATVKLSSRLPGDPEINGLDSLHGRLITDDTPILCLAWVVSTKVVRDLNTDEEVPTVEVRRIEPIASVHAVDQSIVDLAASLYEKRTGRNPLPIGGLVSPVGDVDQLTEDEDEPVQAGEVARTYLAALPDPDADVFVYDAGDES